MGTEVMTILFRPAWTMVSSVGVFIHYIHFQSRLAAKPGIRWERPAPLFWRRRERSSLDMLQPFSLRERNAPYRQGGVPDHDIRFPVKSDAPAFSSSAPQYWLSASGVHNIGPGAAGV